LTAGIFAAITVGLVVTGARPTVRSPVAEALRRSPTTRIVAGRANYLYSPLAGPPIVVVPPSTYFGMGSQIGRGAMAGDVNGGVIQWASSSSGAYIGRPGKSLARGGGLIFAINPAGGGIDAIDELSHGVVWSAPPALPPTKSLAWSDADTILIAGGEGGLRAIDPHTGRLVWSADLVGTIVSDVIPAPGKLIVAVNGDHPKPGDRDEPLVVALDVRNGKPTWRTSLPHLPAGIAADETTRLLYCVGQESRSPGAHTVRALDTASGRVQWDSLDIPLVHEFPIPRVPRTRGPAAGGGVVCVAVEHVLYGFDSLTGKLRWTWSPRAGTDEPSRLGWPLVHDGIVYCTIKNGAIGFDCATGRELWHFALPREDRYPSPTAPPAVFGNLITLPYSDRSVDFVRLPTALRSAPDPAAMAITPVMAISGGIFLIGLLAVAFRWRSVRLSTAVACLLLLAITIVAWKVGYTADYFLGMKHFEYAGRLTAELDTGIFSADGALTIGRRRTVTENAIKQRTLGDLTASLWWTRRPPVILANGVCVEEPANDLGLRHFAWTNRARPSGTILGEQAETSVTVPHWFAAVLFGIPALAWLSGVWRDRGHYPPGHCRNCGYDLRASAGTCPECGSVFVEGKMTHARLRE